MQATLQLNSSGTPACACNQHCCFGLQPVSGVPASWGKVHHVSDAGIRVNERVACFTERLEEAGVALPPPHMCQQNLGTRACVPGCCNT